MNLRNQPDELLIEAARGGDSAALEGLLHRHQDRIYRFSMSLCRNEQDAEDILQETMIALSRHVQQFRGESSLSTWLYTVARSFCIKKHRRERFAQAHIPLQETEASPLERMPDPARDPEERLEGKQLEQHVREAIHELGPLYRETLILRDVEGLTAPQVSEILEISVSAVKSRLHRARIQLRDLLEPVMAEAVEPPPGCPDVLELFSRNLEGEIDALQCAQLQQHLDGCPHCQSACESLKRSLALCQAQGATLRVPEPLQQKIRLAVKRFLLDERT